MIFYFFGALTARTGKQQKYINSLPQFLYAPIDDVAILFSTNQALQYRLKGNDSSGFADTSIEVKYNFAKQYKPTSTKRATIVGMLQLPTGHPISARLPALALLLYFWGLPVIIHQ